MEVASVSYRLHIYERSYHPALYDTVFYHYDSDKIGCKSIVKRTKHYVQCL